MEQRWWMILLIRICLLSSNIEAIIKREYGGLLPKKNPLVSKDRDRVYFDSADWALGKRHSIPNCSQHQTSNRVQDAQLMLLQVKEKFGAFSVFVADGTPSPLKSQARIMRFLQAYGIDPASFPVSNGASVERNKRFTKCVQECVELLEFFGMPVLNASGEAEGLCAQLNREGRVDACITSDSDAFLFGVKCVTKNLKPNSQEPFEWYLMSDIEASLGLKRNHLIAMALLVENDHDLKGVQGIGVETELSFTSLVV